MIFLLYPKALTYLNLKLTDKFLPYKKNKLKPISPQSARFSQMLKDEALYHREFSRHISKKYSGISNETIRKFSKRNFYSNSENSSKKLFSTTTTENESETCWKEKVVECYDDNCKIDRPTFLKNKYNERICLKDQNKRQKSEILRSNRKIERPSVGMNRRSSIDYNHQLQLRALHFNYELDQLHQKHHHHLKKKSIADVVFSTKVISTSDKNSKTKTVKCMTGEKVDPFVYRTTEFIESKKKEQFETNKTLEAIRDFGPKIQYDPSLTQCCGH